MKMQKQALFLVLFIFLTAHGLLFAQQSGDKMRLTLKIASGSAEFLFYLPTDGCVSIITSVQGRRQKDTVWGPVFMKKGSYKMFLPASRIINREGYVELFNIDVGAITSVGARGTGEREFNAPSGLDYDVARNELLVADTGNDRIVRLSADGRFISTHGGFGLAMASSVSEREQSLDAPFDVAVGGFSNFYISDYNNDRICMFDFYKNYKGTLYPQTNNRRARLSRPKGIICDGENCVWAVDSRSNRIIKFDSGGHKLLEVGGYGFSEQQLKDPCQVSLDEYGKIYAADRGKGRIVVYDRLGSYLSEIKDHFKAPAGISIDPDGLLWVCDDETNELSLCTPKGIRLRVFKQTDDGVEFRRPLDVSTAKNKVFMADSYNHRIVVLERKKQSLIAAWQSKTDF